MYTKIKILPQLFRSYCLLIDWAGYMLGFAMAFLV